MSGHSRGDWYASLADIADSAESAEYWAVFGVTHRGNRHCLGEFATEALAWAAVRGLKRFPTRPARTSRSTPRAAAARSAKADSSERAIVQLEVSRDKADTSMVELFALCSDGTVWHRGVGVGRGRGLIDEEWTEITLKGMRPNP